MPCNAFPASTRPTPGHEHTGPPVVVQQWLRGDAPALVDRHRATFGPAARQPQRIPDDEYVVRHATNKTLDEPVSVVHGGEHVLVAAECVLDIEGNYIEAMPVQRMLLPSRFVTVIGVVPSGYPRSDRQSARSSVF